MGGRGSAGGKGSEYATNFSRSKSFIKSREKKYGLGESEITKIGNTTYIRTPKKRQTPIYDKTGAKQIGTRQDYYYTKILSSGEYTGFTPKFTADLNRAKWKKF